MKRFLKKSIIPIVFILIIFPLLIIYATLGNKRAGKEEYEQGARGVIVSITSMGRDSWKTVLKQYNKNNDSVYFLGLGKKDSDILVGDSVFKKEKDIHYYIYRTTMGKDSLIYTKGVRGSY